MTGRRSFLRLVRNRVAAGVLCSGMLTDALGKLGSETGTWSNIVQPNSGFTATAVRATYNEFLKEYTLFPVSIVDDYMEVQNGL